jgi:hypothetical protein
MGNVRGERIQRGTLITGWLVQAPQLGHGAQVAEILVLQAVGEIGHSGLGGHQYVQRLG